jgi:virulence factor Mce-like protein
VQSVKLLRNPVTWGVATLVLVTSVALAAALLYISPPGQKTVVFYTDDAASIRTGDQVRIAGINVGEVKELSLESDRSDRVKVTAKVDNTAFVGDESQVQVRLLTVVGGYYVNLVSLGDVPLGNNAIPLERVTMPYSLIRTLSDATKITDDIDPKPISESLNQIQAGLKGSNIESLSAVIEAGNTLMATIDRQRGQVTKMLSLTDEYIQRLSDFRETLKDMVRKVALLQQTLVVYGNGFGAAIQGVGDLLTALLPVGAFYDEHRDDFIEKVRNFLHKSRLWVERNGLTVRALQHIQDRIHRVLNAQNAPPQLLATDMCIPIPGNPCQ